ncbi:lysophospholipase L1-like esterase [Arenibacter sp. ARW7G5Y1]|nr:lysophospholipase L1-like esterase [Arenibacter sp. ARW7G5Y1]
MILIFQCSIVSAQKTDSLKWWNPAENSFSAIEGQAWTNEAHETYGRLPLRAEKIVRKQVWDLSRNSTGLVIRFKTKAQQITVAYKVKEGLAMPHFSATGVSGVDMYSVNKNGGWNWVPGKYSFTYVGTNKNTITYQYNIIGDNGIYKNGREYRLYLPIYNTVEWLKIGVPENTTLNPMPARIDKPIAIYGTSITQGACVSRPGMAWTSIVGRKLNQPVINLGFSGNGTLDEEIIELMTEIDAKVYVLDCLANLMDRTKFPLEEVKRRLIESVNMIHAKRPMVPIILPAFGAFNEHRLDKDRGTAIDEINETLKQAYTILKASGIVNVYILPAGEMQMGMDDTVDGNHATDLGMINYATAFEKIFRTVLEEPSGNITTTMPCTQYREDAIYNWEERHTELVKMNASNPPKTVLLGSSDVHYWGGQPTSVISRGSDSWNQFIEPLGVRNFGFAGDRIENILWRVEHGELDGYKADKVILMVGGYNLPINNDDEVLKGIKSLIQTIFIKQPQTSILLVGLLPQRSQENRISNLNKKITEIANNYKIQYADPGKLLLNKNEKIDETLFIDGIYPDTEGYSLLAKFLKAELH